MEVGYWAIMEPVLMNSKMELGTHFVFHDGTHFTEFQDLYVESTLKLYETKHT